MYNGPMPPMNTALPDQVAIGRPVNSRWYYQLVVRLFWYVGSACLFALAIGAWMAGPVGSEWVWVAALLVLAAPGLCSMAWRAIGLVRMGIAMVRRVCIHCGASVAGHIGDQCPSCRRHARRPW